MPRTVAPLAAVLAAAALAVSACGSSASTPSTSSSSTTLPATSSSSTTLPATSSSSSSSSSSTSSSSSSTGAALSTGGSISGVSVGTSASFSGEAATVAQNFNKFFNSNSSASDRLSVLQNSSQFASAVQALVGSSFAKNVSANVTNVQVNGNTAKVTYDLSLNGAKVATETGTAVKENGQWKVADTTLCQLLQLGALAGVQLPSACAGAVSSGASS